METIDRQESNKKFYNQAKIVRSYGHKQTLYPAESILFFTYKEEIEGKRVLDLGCGGGRTTPFLAPFAADYLGLDYAMEMVQHCRGRYPEWRFEQADARHLRDYSGFDLVLFSFNGLDYIGHEDRLLALRQIHGVLRPGGVFLFSSHNRHPIAGRETKGPEWSWRGGICRLPGKLKRHLRNLWRFKRSRPGFELTPDHAIINDGAHDYRLLTYYIDPTHQRNQLVDAGFELLGAYDEDGLPLVDGDEKSSSCWIYYAARKIERE